MEDTSLFALVQRNDQHAFEKLFNIYSSELCVLAFQYIKQDEAAQDIVQEFFITLWQKRHALQINTSFRAYAYKAVYHASLNYLRGNKRAEFHKNSFLLQGQHTIKEVIIPLEDPASDLMKRLQSAIDSLPAQCRKIFMLVCLQEMKHAEVAAYMGLSVNTVKVQMSKAYRILRDKMDTTLLAGLILLECFC